MLTSMSLAYTFRELLSLPEDVLVQQLVKIKDENGNIILETVDDPNSASIADQDVVRRKLLSATEKARAMSFVDPRLLSHRLFELAEAVDSSPDTELRTEDCDRTQRRTASPPPVPSKTDHEAMAYIELVRLGGRPACSIDTFRIVQTNPQQYQQILDPWQLQWTTRYSSHSDIKLFSEQLSRWKLFRTWQHKSRGLDPPPELSSFQVSSSFEENPSPGDEIEDSIIREAHERYQVVIISKCIKTEKDNHAVGLGGYGDETQARLRRHKIHRPFTPSSDPRNQTQLNTWLEYIAFEIWWLDTHADFLASGNNVLEQESQARPNDGELAQAQDCDSHYDSRQTSATLSATSESDYNATFEQVTQTIVKNEMARSQRIVDWALAELENVEIEPRPGLNRPNPFRWKTSPLASPLKKRKRGERSGTVSPSPITPAPSFPWDRPPEDARKRRRRTTSGSCSVLKRENSSDLSQILSPAASPEHLADNSPGIIDKNTGEDDGEKAGEVEQVQA